MKNQSTLNPDEQRHFSESETLLRESASRIGMSPEYLDSWIKKKLSPWNQGQISGQAVPPAKSYRIFKVEAYSDHIVVEACADRNSSWSKPPPVPRRMMFGIPLCMREIGKEIFYIR